MIITIIAVGKTRKSFVQEGIYQYEKRISKYAKIKWIWVESSTESTTQKRVESESHKLLKQIVPEDVVYVLDKSGSQYTSIQFAQELNTVQHKGKMVFIIGGSDGLDTSVFIGAKLLSFSLNTFEHDLIRLMLLEQVYRGLDINVGGEYHK